MNVVEFAASDTGQANQGIGIAGFGFARLFEGSARRGVVFAIQCFVALTEQHQVMTGVHQVLPLAHERGVLLFVARFDECGVGVFITTLTQQRQTQCAVKAWIVGVAFDRTAQQTFGHHRGALLLDHLLALRTRQPGRVRQQALLGVQGFVGLKHRRGGGVAFDKRLPCLHGFAVDGQGVEVFVLSVCRRIARLRIGGQLLQHGQRLGRALFSEQQIDQGLSQTGVAGVLAVEGAQLLNHLGPLAGNVAANTQVLQRRGKVRRGVAKQLFKNGCRLFRAPRSGEQSRLLQGFLTLRVLQLHQALGLT